MNKINGNSVYRSTVEYHGPVRGGRSAPFMNRLVGAFNSGGCCSCRTNSVEYVAAGDRLVDQLKPFPAVKAVLIDILHLTDAGLDGDLDTFEDSLTNELRRFRKVILENPSDKLRPVKSMSNKSLKTRLRFESGISEGLGRIVSILKPEQAKPGYATVVPSLGSCHVIDQLDEALPEIHSRFFESAVQKKNTFQITAHHNGVSERP